MVAHQGRLRRKLSGEPDIRITDTFATPRVLLALGTDGFLPKAVGDIDPVRKTPMIAIVCYVGLALVLALSAGFAALALVAASSTLVMYRAECRFFAEPA
jgi:amino acid transporter